MALERYDRNLEPAADGLWTPAKPALELEAELGRLREQYDTDVERLSGEHAADRSEWNQERERLRARFEELSADHAACQNRVATLARQVELRDERIEALTQRLRQIRESCSDVVPDPIDERLDALRGHLRAALAALE